VLSSGTLFVFSLSFSVPRDDLLVGAFMSLCSITKDQSNERFFLFICLSFEDDAFLLLLPLPFPVR
jgi:hypothetical protein